MLSKINFDEKNLIHISLARLHSWCLRLSLALLISCLTTVANAQEVSRHPSALEQAQREAREYKAGHKNGKHAPAIPEAEKPRQANYVLPPPHYQFYRPSHSPEPTIERDYRVNPPIAMNPDQYDSVGNEIHSSKRQNGSPKKLGDASNSYRPIARESRKEAQEAELARFGHPLHDPRPPTPPIPESDEYHNGNLRKFEAAEREQQEAINQYRNGNHPTGLEQLQLSAKEYIARHRGTSTAEEQPCDVEKNVTCKTLKTAAK